MALLSWGHRYDIKTSDEAKTVAEFIVNDNQTCLSYPYNFHSHGCGDGEACASKKRMLAQALAAYYLAL